MSKNLFIVFLFFGHLFFGQESAKSVAKNKTQKDRYDYRAKIYGELIIPIATGDNFVANGFDVNRGFVIRAELLQPKLSYGLQYDRFEGRPNETALTGFIDKTTFSHVVFYAKYHLLEQKDWFYLSPRAGIGSSTYTNSIGSTRFFDSGFTVLVGLDTSFRVSDQISFNIGLSQIWDFLSIDTAQEIENDFNTTQFFVPSFGIQLHLIAR